MSQFRVGLCPVEMAARASTVNGVGDVVSVLQTALKDLVDYGLCCLEGVLGI